jgi:hypothetical protein
MTRTQKLLLAWLDLYDTLTSPEAKDVYAGLAAVARESRAHTGK